MQPGWLVLVWVERGRVVFIFAHNVSWARFFFESVLSYYENVEDESLVLGDFFELRKEILEIFFKKVLDQNS